MKRLRRYFDEVWSELKKVSWPTREQVRNLTVLVFAISFVVGLYITVLDAIFGSIFFVYGLANTDLAVGATLSSLSPLISVPFAIALGEERWSAPRAIAITATVGGIVLLVGGTG